MIFLLFFVVHFEIFFVNMLRDFSLKKWGEMLHDCFLG